MNAMETVVIRVNENDLGDVKPFEWWLERGRRWWTAKADRVLNSKELVVLDATNRVRALGAIYGVLKDIENGTGRVSIEVLPIEGSELLGKEIRRSESRNPVAYMTDIEVVSE